MRQRTKTNVEGVARILFQRIKIATTVLLVARQKDDKAVVNERT